MRRTRGLLALAPVLGLVPLLALNPPAAPAQSEPVQATYVNPLKPVISGRRTVQNCADPSVLQGRGADAGRWFMYCTSDPLDDVDTSGSGGPTFRRLPMMTSRNLVSWSYVGPALPARPSWAATKAKLWAPDVSYSSALRRYFMTFTVTDTRDGVSGQPGCAQDPAIAVAVSSRPTGPWRVAGAPVVRPMRLGPGCDFASTIDSDLIGADAARSGVLYFGGFRGGVFGQRVATSTSGLRVVGAPTRLTVDRRFEGANVVHRADWYYLTVSAGTCCQGHMSGYAVFAGRSPSPLGPFVDAQGVPLTASRAGGTPVMSANGNRWIGPGHSSMFPDRGGQWWVVYHAVDHFDPAFATEPGFTRRPPMLDPVDWRAGWPTVRTGRGPSDARLPAPAGQPGQKTRYVPSPAPSDRPGGLLPAYSDEFDGTELDDAWSWVREPDASAYSVADGELHRDTESKQLYADADDASVLLRPAPPGDFVVETQLGLDVPETGCCFDAAQAGLVLYAGDDAYLKLTHSAAGLTRQTGFAKEIPGSRAGFPRYGSTQAGPPGDVTGLRIVRRAVGGVVVYRAYTQRDGGVWVRGSTWRQDGLGATSAIRVGLVAMGRAGHEATYDYVRVSQLP